jgi:hypothetical protein
VDRDVKAPPVVETIIALDRKELLSLLREVQDMDVPVEDEPLTEPDVVWVA